MQYDRLFIEGFPPVLKLLRLKKTRRKGPQVSNILVVVSSLSKMTFRILGPPTDYDSIWNSYDYVTKLTLRTIARIFGNIDEIVLQGFLDLESTTFDDEQRENMRSEAVKNGEEFGALVSRDLAELHIVHCLQHQSYVSFWRELFFLVVSGAIDVKETLSHRLVVNICHELDDLARAFSESSAI